MISIKEVIVVEGKKDTAKIKQAVNAETIETNGSAIDEATLKLIKHAQERCGVIVFTDPDFPGNKIRDTIINAVSNCKHAYLSRDEAMGKKGKKQTLGIEHATIEAIQQALTNVQTCILQDEQSFNITNRDLFKLGLMGTIGSNKKREKLGTFLRIGKPNGKQLLKRLRIFGIDLETLYQAIDEIKN